MSNFLRLFLSDSSREATRFTQQSARRQPPPPATKEILSCTFTVEGPSSWALFCPALTYASAELRMDVDDDMLKPASDCSGEIGSSS